jgi:hypothetical protein
VGERICRFKAREQTAFKKYKTTGEEYRNPREVAALRARGG